MTVKAISVKNILVTFFWFSSANLHCLVFASNLAHLTHFQMSLKDLLSENGKTCSFLDEPQCNICESSIDFRYTVTFTDQNSRNCLTSGYNLDQQCICCTLPDEKLGRLFRIQYDLKGCSKNFTDLVKAKHSLIFDGLRNVTQLDCADKQLNSKYNLILAKGVTKVFSIPLLSYFEESRCDADFDCTKPFRCINGVCTTGKPISEPVLIVIASGSAFLLFTFYMLIIKCFWSKNRNDEIN